MPSRHTAIYTESWDCFPFVHSYAFPLWTPPFYVWFFYVCGSIHCVTIYRSVTPAQQMALGLFTSLPNRTICYQVSILWQKTIFAHIVYDYTVNICTYYEHTILFSISPLTFLLSFLLHCLFFTIIIVYCYSELSFGCCDAHISLELIKELLLRILISALDAWVQDELEKQTRLAEKQNWLKETKESDKK